MTVANMQSLSKHPLTRWMALAAIIGLLQSPVGRPHEVRADTDFGQVAMYVANMLRSNHYSRLEFDDVVSRRLLDHYLNFLDAQRRYFYQSDIDQFVERFGDSLDDRILMRDVSAAHEIYDLFQKRVEERSERIRELLSDPDQFTFDSDRTVEMSRAESSWPASTEEADALWRDIIEGDMLQEVLLREGASGDSLDEALADPTGENESSDPSVPVEERVLERYTRVLESLKENDEEDIVNYFLSSLAAVYDPHSEYFSQSEMDNFQVSMSQRLSGIGALLGMRDGAAEIQGLMVGGPAELDGRLQINDRIIAVGQGLDGPLEDVMYMKLQKIVEQIRGNRGTYVRLKVIPADAADPSQTRIIELRRDEVELKDRLANADLIKMQGEGGEIRRIGWIYLSSFYADMDGGATSTTTDVRRLLLRLKRENIDGLVLDLRGNGGGSLEEAINLTGLFIPSGPVVQAKNWRDEVTFRESTSPGAFYDGPLVILTDKASASASEILAAALQDYQRAVIVGEASTFGKGTVQTILPVARYMPFFSDKKRAGALKVTIQKFYRIAGGSTQLRGVEPDIVLPSVRDALDIGESALQNPLEYDEIPSRQFAMFERSPLPIDQLRELSRERVHSDPEFIQIMEDIERLKSRIEANVVSLNKEERLQELEENKAREEQRKEERAARVASAEEEEADRFQVFRLTLENVDKPELVSRADFTEEDSTGMRMGENGRRPGRGTSPEDFPHGMDPVKMEALHVLNDLVELTSDAPKTAASAAE